MKRVCGGGTRNAARWELSWVIQAGIGKVQSALSLSSYSPEPFFSPLKTRVQAPFSTSSLPDTSLQEAAHWLLPGIPGAPHFPFTPVNVLGSRGGMQQSWASRSLQLLFGCGKDLPFGPSPRFCPVLWDLLTASSLHPRTPTLFTLAGSSIFLAAPNS